MPSNEPAPEQAPAPEAPAAEPQQGGGDQAVQKLVGQLGQQIRTSQNVSSDDIKGAVNSILAAAKGKLNPDAVADIEKKLSSVGQGDAPAGDQGAPAPGGEQAQEPVQQEQVLGETEPGAQGQDQPNALPSLLQNEYVADVVREAGLDVEIQENPVALSQQVLEGFALFLSRFGKKSPEYSQIESVLSQAGYDEFESPAVDVNDLDVDGQIIYHTLEARSKKKFGDFGISRDDVDQISNPDHGYVPANHRTSIAPEYAASINENKKRIKLTESQVVKLLSKIK